MEKFRIWQSNGIQWCHTCILLSVWYTYRLLLLHYSKTYKKIFDFISDFLAVLSFRLLTLKVIIMIIIIVIIIIIMIMIIIIIIMMIFTVALYMWLFNCIISLIWTYAVVRGSSAKIM